MDFLYYIYFTKICIYLTIYFYHKHRHTSSSNWKVKYNFPLLVILKIHYIGIQAVLNSKLICILKLILEITFIEPKPTKIIFYLNLKAISLGRYFFSLFTYASGFALGLVMYWYATWIPSEEVAIIFNMVDYYSTYLYNKKPHFMT